MAGLVRIDKASISFLKSNMQFVSVEKHSIGNILPLWHKKLMHYSQPNARLNLRFCQMETEKKKMLRKCWIHKAWPSLLSQTPHLCHNGLQGQAFVKAVKTLNLNPFKRLWSHAQRSNFLSSYWSSWWTETWRLIERRYDLISAFDIVGKRKL